MISNASDATIYGQIYSQIKSRIISGELCEGDVLPSIRALAKDLRISVITTKRAYDELGKDGFVHAVAGKGCYVAQRNAALIREDNLKQIEEHMRRILRLAPSCNLSDDELMELFRIIRKEEISCTQ